MGRPGSHALNQAPLPRYDCELISYLGPLRPLNRWIIIKSHCEKLLLRMEPGYSSTEERYKQLRLKLTKFFAWRHCHDPEVLADETIMRTIKNINSGEEILATNPYSYLYAVATNVFREYVREMKKQEAIAEENIQDLTTSLDYGSDCRRECIERLSPDRLKMLQEYYMDEEDRVGIAASRGISLNALRLQVHRIKNELRRCYEECIKKLSGSGN